MSASATTIDPRKEPKEMNETPAEAFAAFVAGDSPPSPIDAPPAVRLPAPNLAQGTSGLGLEARPSAAAAFASVLDSLYAPGRGNGGWYQLVPTSI